MVIGAPRGLLAALAGLVAAASAPALAAPTPRDLVEMTELSGPVLSPNGQYVVFRQNQASIERNRQDLSWWIARTDGRVPPRRLVGGGEAIWRDYGVLRAEPAVWSSDSQFVFFRALIDGQVQVWRAGLDGAAFQVSHDDADVEAFTLSRDASRLIYAVGPTREALRRAEARQYDEGVRIDAQVDPSQSLFGAIEINGRLAAQRLVGSWFDHGTLLWNEPRRYLSQDLVAGARRAVDEVEAAAVGLAPPPKAKLLSAPAVRAGSPNGGQLAFVDHEGGASRLTVRRGEAVAARCPDAACGGRIVSLAWRGEDEVVFTVIDAARRQTLMTWRPATQAIRVIAAGEGLLDGGDGQDAPCAIDATQAICVAASAASPPSLVRIDLDTGQSTVLASPNLALLDGAPTVQARTWRDALGRVFTGQLVLPAKAKPLKPWPLFVTYYVCDGYLRGGTGDEWPLAPLAASGVAALCVNKTPSPPGAFDPVGDYRAAQSGIEAAIDLLAAEGLVDPRRVGMGGLSFGSEVTTWMAMHSNRLAAASIASTQVEPSYYWANAVAGRDTPRLLRQAWGLGPPGETPKAWAAVSPALNVGRISAPMLVQIPEQEYRMIPEFIAKLSRSTTPSEIYAFPNEPHLLIQPRHRAAAYARNLDWFRFWLQGVEDPDPAKAEQYARWRAMAARRTSARPGPTP